VDVGTVRDRVGVAEAAAEVRIDGDVDHLLPRHAVHQEQPLDEHRVLLDELADPERVEDVKRVRTELDPGAELAELVRLLEDGDAKSALCESQRASEPPDTAARNHDGLLVTWRALHSLSRTCVTRLFPIGRQGQGARARPRPAARSVRGTKLPSSSRVCRESGVAGRCAEIASASVLASLGSTIGRVTNARR
jgi:hypothetical protein